MHFIENTILATNNNNLSNRDVDLISRICNADEKALEELYHHYYPRLYRFIGRITWHDATIGEVINEVMYLVWSKAETYNHQSKPSTWILGIAYNIARRANEKIAFFAEESLDDLDENNLNLEDKNCSFQQMETANWLESALEVLTLEQRTVIELTYFDGLHYSEIAEIMGCPENTIKTRMHHARKKMAMVLNTTG